jgi:hypothetical protein
MSDEQQQEQVQVTLPAQPKLRVGRSTRLHPLRASGRTSGAGGSAAGLGRPTSSSAPVKAIAATANLKLKAAHSFFILSRGSPLDYAICAKERIFP